MQRLSPFLPGIFLFCFMIFSSTVVWAQIDTPFRVVVKAEDAKFIGTGVGGAQVVITDRRTGDILVQGTTAGSTNGSEALLADKRSRDAVLTSDESADFEFSLNMFEPVPVTVTASAPLAQQQSMVSASKDMLFLPGKDYTDGNAILLEIPGFIVDVLSPPAHSKIPFDAGKTLALTANILKLCGCHVAEDSPWPPEAYEVEAHIYRNGAYLVSAPMVHDGSPGLFRHQLKFSQPGTYRIDVTAFDHATKEAGMDSTTLVLVE